MRIKIFILSLFLSLFALQSIAQTDTEFWFAVPQITKDHDWGRKKFYFRFANMDKPNTITIFMPASSNPDFDPLLGEQYFEPIVLNVPANEAIDVDVTDIIEEMWNEDPYNEFNPLSIYNRGIKITATNLTTAYFEVGTHNNPDIFSLKGANALGTDFFVPFQNYFSNGHMHDLAYSSIDIVATEDNTQITITPTQPVSPNNNTDPFTVTLNTGQSISLAPWDYPVQGQLSGNHLGGTRIESNKPIAVTTSDDSVWARPHGGCRDLIGDQLIPVSIIGTEYIAMKGRLTIPEFFYVVGTQDGTEIEIDQIVTDVINAGETRRYEMTHQNYHIKTSEPAYVYHVAGFGCEMGGAVLPPINVCTGSFKVSFTRSKGESFFMNILVRAGAEDGFIMNGDGPNTIIAAEDFVAVPGTNSWLAAEFEFDQATIPVGDASFLENIKDVFHLGIINGGRTTGTMYGYFSNFNEIQVGAGIGSVEGPHTLFGCHGDEFQLVASDGINHQWSPPDFLNDPTISNPVATPDETMAYTVVITGACQVTASATITINLFPPVLSIFDVENTVGCSPFDLFIDNYSIGVDHFSWRFGDGNTSATDAESFSHLYEHDEDVPQIYDLKLVGRSLICFDTLETQITVLPEVSTRIVMDETQHEELVFTDTLITGCAPFDLTFDHASNRASDYLWDFGDGNTSNAEKPVHTFENNTSEPIIYPVVLRASSTFGTDQACDAWDTVYVRVNPFIRSGFEVDPPQHCNPYPLSLTNTSVGAGAFYWDFGNGDTSTDALPEYTFTNLTSVPQTNEVMLAVENQFGCADTMFREVMVFPYLEADFEPSATELCNPGTVSFQNMSQGSTTWQWDFDDAGSSSLENPQDIIFEHTDPDHEKIFHVQLTSISEFGCEEIRSIPITIAPYLKAGFAFPGDALCSPFGVAHLEIENQSIGSKTTQWKITNTTDNTGDVFESNDDVFEYEFHNTSDEPVTYTITQTVMNDHGCQRELTKEILIYPEVKSVIDPVTSSCHPMQIQFSHDAVNAYSYRWEFSDGSVSYEENPQKLFLNNSFTQSREITAQLFVESTWGCRHDTLINFEVFPKPAADFNIPQPQGCSPFEVSMTDQSITLNNSTYQWMMGSTADTISTEPGMVYTFENTSEVVENLEITLYLTNSFGCSDTVVRQIAVFPNIKADFSMDMVSGCHPLHVEFTNFSEGATHAMPFQWHYGNGSSTQNDLQHTHIFNNFSKTDLRNYNIELIAKSLYGCADTISKEVTVYPVPAADYLVDESEGCSPHPAEFQDLSQGNNLSYEWFFEEGQTSAQEGDVSYTFTQPYDAGVGSFYTSLRVENAFGCADTIRKLVTVYPDIEADYTASTFQGCHPLNVVFTNTSSGAENNSWFFDNGNFSSAADPQNTFINNSHDATEDYAVQLTVSSVYGCMDSVVKNIEVFPKPDADFAVSDIQGCSPLEVSFSDQSSGTGSELYQWQFDENHTEQTGAGNAGFIYENPAEFADSINVALTLSNTWGCKDSASTQIVVFPDIKADFSLDQWQGCHPLDVNISNNSTGASSSQPYQWFYGNGSSTIDEEEHVHRFNNFDHYENRSYDLKLIARSSYGCIDSVTQEIVVHPVPHANYEVLDIAGCSPHLAEFADLSEGENMDYEWFFEENETSNQQGDVIHVYHQPYDEETGVFTSSLTVTNAYGCSSSHSNTVTVYPDIIADFDVVQQGCHPLQVDFENLSLGASMFNWNFSDGNTSNKPHPANTFFNSTHHETRKYPVVLNVSSVYGCTSVATDTIEVFPSPRVSFQVDVTQGCSPLVVGFENQSEGVAVYEWDFGNASSSNGNDQFYHTFENYIAVPDTFLVSLTGSNSWGCTKTSEKEVISFPQVKAAFYSESGIYEGCAPLHLSFVNVSELATKYVWYFDEETTSSSIDSEHTFYNSTLKSTDFEVGLKAISTFGCEDYTTKDVTVFEQPVADFDASPHFQIFPDKTIYVTNYSSPGPWDYSWDMGDGQTFETKDATPFEYTYEWNYDTFATREFEIHLKVTGDQCEDTISQKVTINAPNPVVGFEPSAQGCPPFEVQFTNDSQYGTSFEWDFDDGTVSEEENPVHVFEEPGVYEVKLKVSGEGGSESGTQRITVFEPPIADFTLQNFHLEIPRDDAQLINLSSLGSTYRWDFGDGNTSDEFEPVHTYMQEGVYDIRLEVGTDTDPQCFDEIIKEGVVTVGALPCDMIFPNAFTPNTSGGNGGGYSINDPSNHVFHPVFTGVSEYKLEIFNRWGEILFVSDDIMVGWDGYYRGKLSPMGVYVYKATAVCETGKEIKKTGDVTLFR